VLIFGVTHCVCYKQSSQASGGAHVTVERSAGSDRGRHRHTRITIHRVPPGSNNPFQEYDSFSMSPVVLCTEQTQFTEY